MDEKDRAVSDEPYALLNIDLRKSRVLKGPLRQELEFLTGRVRNVFEDFFDISSTYNLLRSTANPEAVDLVREHSKELTIARHGKDAEISVAFGHDVRGEYLKVIDALAMNSKIHQKRYDLVNNNVGFQFNYTMVVYWPEIHVVKGDESAVAKFKSLFTQLHSEEAFQMLREAEAPQNYNLGVIKLLKKHKVLPLKLESRIWTVPGKELKNAIDFLCTFELNRIPEIHSDD